MQFNKIKKIFLFGGSPLLLNSANYFRETKNIEPVIYTAERQAEEVVTRCGKTLRGALLKDKFNFFISEDINQESNLLNQIDDHSLGLGLGEAWSFNQTIINKFNGHLIDFMGIPHPKYRGGAHYSWLIMSGKREWGCNLQVINAEMVQGKFDSGDIIKSKSYSFPDDLTIPQDYFDYAVKEEIKFIDEFFNEITERKSFALKKADESQSLFFPRLNTKIHGWIDWSMGAQHILRFIHAFDNPYMGASTLIHNKRVNIKNVSLEKLQDFHPFQVGLITRVSQDAIYIIVDSGLLKIRELLFNNERYNNSINVGDRFYTPINLLEKAKTTNIDYTTKKEPAYDA